MSEDNEFFEELSAFDKDYTNAEEVEKKNFDPIPNGKYQVFVDKIYLDRTKTAQEIVLKWELVIIAGKFIRRRLFRQNMIVSNENLKWLKTDLLTVNVVLKDITNLPNELENILDTCIEITVRNKKSTVDGIVYENVNIYLNKILDIKIPEEARKQQGDEEEADIKPECDHNDIPF